MKGAPRQFDDLAAFVSKCETAVASDPEACVLFGHLRQLRRTSIRLIPGGPAAKVIGWDAEARVTVLEIGARVALDVIKQGHFVDRRGL